MRVSVPIDSSDAKATSSGDTTRRDGFGIPHAGANTTVSNGPTDARSTNRRIMELALPTFGQLIAEPTFILIDTAIVGHIGDAALAGLSIGSTIIPVSYTHLDVYKRQVLSHGFAHTRALHFNGHIFAGFQRGAMHLRQ